MRATAMYSPVMFLLGGLRFVYGGFRILGGNQALIEENPWDVSIQITDHHTCGGAIIGPDTILTAAHCMIAHRHRHHGLDLHPDYFVKQLRGMLSEQCLSEMNIPRKFCCPLMALLGSLSLVSGAARIVGGNATTIEKHPWQVSIQIFGVHSCGGSIVSTDTILTAAHCIEEILVELYQIVVGTTDLTQPSSKVSVKEFIIHSDYNSETYDYDIAILKLNENLTFTEKIQPISLPEQGYQVPDGTTLIASGWGVTETDGSDFTDILRDVEIKAINWSECSRRLSSAGSFTDRMMCAGVAGGGKDTCQGDSGGAVELDGAVIGIVSWGAECGNADYPGVYTLVSYFRSWIKEHGSV